MQNNSDKIAKKQKKMQKYLRMSKKSSTFARFFAKWRKARCHRITVSTQDFHSCNRGSIPLGTTKTFPKVNS